MKISYLYYVIYILIALLHVYIVKSNFLVVFLVIIFEITRLIALLNKAKVVIFILAIFSCIFIVSNYKSNFDNAKKVAENQLKIASNINKYTSKYWISGDKLTELIDIQSKNVKNISTKPHWIVVAILVVLIELSMAYMIIINKPIVVAKIPPNALINNPKPIFTQPSTPLIRNEQVKVEAEQKAVQELPDNPDALELEGIPKLAIIDEKYFYGKERISKSYYYKLRKELQK